MARAGVIGLIRTPKERLVAAIIDALRHIAPESAYHFRELAGHSYHLKLYWGSDSAELIFNEQQALASADEQGKENIRSALVGAFMEMLRKKKGD
jgi:hypothetical protein